MAITRHQRNAALGGERISVGKRRFNTSCVEHWHEYLEIIHYRGCRGKCTLNGIEREISENCIFLMSPKDFHKVENEPNPNASSVVVQFCEQAVSVKLLELINASPVVLYEPSEKISAFIDELEAVSRKNSRFKEEYMSYLLGCILVSVIEEGSCVCASTGKNDPIIRESISYMLANLHKPISLTEIADKYGVSPTYFSHRFHTATGSPFKKYLTGLRIEYAKRMLEDGDLPIIDVGYECGFHTPSQFVRAFKAEMGEAPSKYRQKKRKSRTN